MIENRNPLDGRLQDLGVKKAFLIGAYEKSQEKEICLSYLDELAALSWTYGLEVVEKLPCHLRKIESATYFGIGKIEEVKSRLGELGAELLVCDEEISPHQQRNLEKLLMCPVIDRTELILGVFAKRARTKEAHIQVDLARCKYQLPRLKRMWTHLGRQRTGGSSSTGGYLKGAGETQIEIDRRALKRKIATLSKELEEVKKQRQVQRSFRERTRIPSFAIVGYTNAGKSTLLNALTQAGVLVEDKLFATLDTTARQFILPNKQKILLVDTVGFIRKLPHMLVASFRSTLEEAVRCDILLHIIDVSSKEAEIQAEASRKVLEELEATDRHVITCLNKVDQIEDRSLVHKLKLKYPKCVEISALKKEGFDQLFNLMIKEIASLRKVVRLRLPQSHYSIIGQIMKEGRVVSSEYEENDILLEVEIPSSLEFKIKAFEVDNF